MSQILRRLSLCDTWWRADDVGGEGGGYGVCGSPFNVTLKTSGGLYRKG
jgi:hypothetical protein